MPTRPTASGEKLPLSPTAQRYVLHCTTPPRLAAHLAVGLLRRLQLLPQRRHLPGMLLSSCRELR